MHSIRAGINAAALWNVAHRDHILLTLRGMVSFINSVIANKKYSTPYGVAKKREFFYSHSTPFGVMEKTELRAINIRPLRGR